GSGQAVGGCPGVVGRGVGWGGGGEQDAVGEVEQLLGVGQGLVAGRGGPQAGVDVLGDRVVGGGRVGRAATVAQRVEDFVVGADRPGGRGRGPAAGGPAAALAVAAEQRPDGQ